MQLTYARGVIVAWMVGVAGLHAGASPIDLTGHFNADTFADGTSDGAGTGYRDPLNEKFLAAALPGDNVLNAGGISFVLGPYGSGNNTVRIDSGGAVTLDIADARMSQLSFVHTGVGFNISPAGAINGTVKVNYLDGTFSTATWDLADNDGNNANGMSQTALSGLSLYRFSNNTLQATGRRLWYQTITGIDHARTVASLEFSAAAVAADTDADFGIYALDAAPSSFRPVDLTSKFNRDTIASVRLSEPSGNGYRLGGEVFVTTAAGNNGGTNTTNVPQTGEIIANGTPFDLGPIDSADTLQNNTWMLGVSGSAVNVQTDTLDIADVAGESLSVLFTAVGFNAPTNQAGNNGTLTVTYTDATSQVFEWDVVDHGGGGHGGLAQAALSNIDQYRTGTDTFDHTDTRKLWMQTFAIDPTRTIDSLSFSVVGVVDGAGNDAEFGIYAVTVAVPEPGALATAAVLAGLFAARRRNAWSA